MRPRLGSRVLVLFLCLFLAALIIGIPESSAGNSEAVAVGTAATTSVTAGHGTGAADRDEIERRLALPPFAYVAESDTDAAKIQAGLDGQTGAAAFVDSATDTLAARPVAGTNLNCVAVAPDGSRLYVTDYNEAVLHVFDAETKKEMLKIALPGVEPRHPTWLTKAVQDQGFTFAYELMRPCSNGVACTPDGAWVLVCSSAGLQVVDTATNQVVRTLSDLHCDLVAVSFDGKRAYVTCDTLDLLAPQSFLDWMRTIMTTEDSRLVCLDLETWQIVNEIPTTTVAGIAVKPDDTQVFFSETYQKRVRVVDALTLADVWEVSTEPSYSVGIGFLPNGTKAYVVGFADSGYYDSSGQQTLPTAPKAEDFFCAVIDTQDKEIIKRIPLEAY